MNTGIIRRGERIAYLDYSRVFVALLVIYGHVLPYTNYVPRAFVYSFHMPFFFIVSGMLHKYKGHINWEKYLRTLIVPALSFNIILWLIGTPLFYYGIWDYAARYYNNVLPDTLFATYTEIAIGGGEGYYNGAWNSSKWTMLVFVCIVLVQDSN